MKESLYSLMEFVVVSLLLVFYTAHYGNTVAING